MQTVSFETAKELKEAGFPCPSPLVYGQMYYSPTGVLLSVVINTHLGRGIFAPTATDLIPPGWYLIRKPKDDDLKSEEWTCSEAVTPEWFHNDNPAEAAAQAWLFVNRNQSNV